MERFRDVLLDVWREACRHIEIHESAGTIAAMLAQHLPLACLLVRRLDVAAPGARHGRPRPAGAWADSRRPRERRSRQPSSNACWRGRASSELLHGQRLKRSGDLAVLVPPEIEGEVLAGPLAGPRWSGRCADPRRRASEVVPAAALADGRGAARAVLRRAGKRPPLARAGGPPRSGRGRSPVAACRDWGGRKWARRSSAPSRACST